MALLHVRACLTVRGHPLGLFMHAGSPGANRGRSCLTRNPLTASVPAGEAWGVANVSMRLSVCLRSRAAVRLSAYVYLPELVQLVNCGGESV